MSKKIKAISLVLAAILSTGIIAGCTAKESGGESGGGSAQNGAVHPMRYVTPGTLAPDAQTGIDAVNEKLLADGYDIAFEPIRVPWDAYDQKINLMLSSGEEFELIHVMQDVKNLSSLASRSALLPLDDYLDKYPNLKNMFSDTSWSSAVYNDQIYAVPCEWRSFENVNGALAVRYDIMKEFTETMPDTIDGMLELMGNMQQRIQEKDGVKAYHWPHQLSVPPYWLHTYYDNYPFYVERSLGVILARQDGSIESYYESEEFKKDAQTYRQMNLAGYISPDILNMVDDTKTDVVHLGAFLPSETFSYGDFITMEKDNDEIQGEMMFANPNQPNMEYTLTQNLNAVSATSEDPESGLKFLDWLYTSKENHDLFHYGIEGTHYTASAENRIEKMKNDSNNTLYEFDTWMSGYLPYIRYDELLSEKGIEWEQYESENKVMTPIAGFLFDASAISSQLTSLEAEIIASIYPIKYGLVDYDEAFPEALKRLKAAGLDDYVAEYQRQFSEYLEKNPDVIQ